MDTVDTIAELTRNWGGDPDRLYGKSPNTHADELQHKPLRGLLKHMIGVARAHHISTHFPSPPIEADPQRYYNLYTILDEVSVALQVPAPKKIFVVPDYQGASLFPFTHELFVGIEMMNMLSSQELKSIIGHEMQHSRQDHTIKILENALLALSEHITYQMKKKEICGNRQMSDLVLKYTEWLAERNLQREIDADSGGATVSSPEIVARALLRCTSQIYDIPFQEVPENILINEVKRLDEIACQQCSPSEYIAIKSHSLAERIQNVRHLRAMDSLPHTR